MKKDKGVDTYLDHIDKIINYGNQSLAAKEQSKKTFREWEKKYDELFEEAPFWRRWYHCWMVSKNRHHIFRCKDSIGVPEKAELVYASAFTQTFPSTHDMPEWALSTRMADIMILRGISVKDSARYRVVVKEHFYNHELVRAIIEFDLYRLKAE